jgi:hypothetical protein
MEHVVRWAVDVTMSIPVLTVSVTPALAQEREKGHH